MIEFKNTNHETPYLKFKEKYEDAANLNQENIEAICISSFSKSSNQVNSRYVNLKFLDNDNFIFFTNYKSPKSQEFQEHNQITGLFYWNRTNTQIRLKGVIEKTSKELNDDYFLKRSKKKNALALSSFQSDRIDSYESIKKNYNEYLETGNLNTCPEYWGGYSFTPYYFEFWEGHESRLNKRDVYEIKENKWNHFILQP